MSMDVLNRLKITATPRRDSLADRVVMILKRFILIDDLIAGTRLPSERRMAETLNVSRTVLREALSHLVGEGILVRTSPRILQVADYDRDALASSLSPIDNDNLRFIDLMELRYILEIGSIPIIVEKLTPERLAPIEHWAEESGRQLAAGKPGHATDVAFHTALLRSIGNPAIDSMLPLVEEQVREYLMFDPHQLAESRRPATERVAREHREIVEAIKERNTYVALEAMARHLSTYFSAMRDVEQQSKETPISPESQMETRATMQTGS